MEENEFKGSLLKTPGKQKRRKDNITSPDELIGHEVVCPSPGLPGWAPTSGWLRAGCFASRAEPREIAILSIKMIRYIQKSAVTAASKNVNIYDVPEVTAFFFLSRFKHVGNLRSRGHV